MLLDQGKSAKGFGTKPLQTSLEEKPNIKRGSGKSKLDKGPLEDVHGSGDGRICSSLG